MRKADIVVKKILVIRFRQIGDAVLSTALCSSLKRSFPDAALHIILNERIAPLLENHPDIDKVIPFSSDANKNAFTYLRWVWGVVKREKYDVIIDMRATVKTLAFSLFSLFTFKKVLRVGRSKSYSRVLLHRRVDINAFPCDRVLINQKYADALGDIKPIIPVSDFRLYPKDDELLDMRRYMIEKGIDFDRPVLLFGVTTKLAHKKWNMDYMKEVVSRVIARYPRVQIIFNYAPGEEAREAMALFEELGRPSEIRIDVEACSLRSLLAMCANCTFYFGNEGGTRHLIQAVGVPSLSIFSPACGKGIWLPHNSTPAEGIEPKDIVGNDTDGLSYNELFMKLTPDAVCGRLFPLLDKIMG